MQRIALTNKHAVSGEQCRFAVPCPMRGYFSLAGNVAIWSFANELRDDAEAPPG